MKNVQNMKPVQVCTGFIFCTFPATVTARHNYRAYFKQLKFSNSIVTSFSKVLVVKSASALFV